MIYTMKPKTIPELIKAKRKKMKLTQEKFGKRIGKSRSDIANYENARCVPPGDVLLKIQQLQAGSRP